MADIDRHRQTLSDIDTRTRIEFALMGRKRDKENGENENESTVMHMSVEFGRQHWAT